MHTERKREREQWKRVSLVKFKIDQLYGGRWVLSSVHYATLPAKGQQSNFSILNLRVFPPHELLVKLGRICLGFLQILHAELLFFYIFKIV